MPIRRSKYPKGWVTVIRPRILARDGWRCTTCGLPDHAVGYRDANRRFVPAVGNAVLDAAGQGLSWPSLERLTFKEADAIVLDLKASGALEEADGRWWFVVLLNVAHRDHALVNHTDENLHCLCQQCHIRYDKPISGPKAGYTRKYSRTSGLLDFSRPTG